MPRKPLIVADSGIPGAEATFGALGELRLLAPAKMSADTLADAAILVVRSVVPVGKELLSGTRIRMVGSATAGTDHVDLPYLKEAGIAFSHAPGANADSVADQVITTLLALAAKEGAGLKGMCLGVVGCGQVGSRVRARASALGMGVLVSDPPLARRGHPGTFTSLRGLLERCDAISLHTPLVPTGEDATKHLIGEGELARFEGWLVNTARGPVVDNAALVRKRKAGLGPRFVALDVWETEPDIDPQLLAQTEWATPHVAGYAAESKWEATRQMAVAIARHLGREVAEAPPALGTVRLQAPRHGTPSDSCPDDWSWLSRLALSMCPLERDDTAIRRFPGRDAFEAYRSRYPGKRLMRSHRVEGVPVHLKTIVREALTCQVE